MDIGTPEKSCHKIQPMGGPEKELHSLRLIQEWSISIFNMWAHLLTSPWKRGGSISLQPLFWKPERRPRQGTTHHWPDNLFPSHPLCHGGPPWFGRGRYYTSGGQVTFLLITHFSAVGPQPNQPSMAEPAFLSYPQQGEGGSQGTLQFTLTTKLPQLTTPLCPPTYQRPS